MYPKRPNSITEFSVLVVDNRVRTDFKEMTKIQCENPQLQIGYHDCIEMCRSQIWIMLVCDAYFMCKF